MTLKRARLCTYTNAPVTRYESEISEPRAWLCGIVVFHGGAGNVLKINNNIFIVKGTCTHS